MKRLLFVLLAIFFTTTAAETINVTIKPLSTLWQTQTFDAPADVIALQRPVVSAQLAAEVNKVNVEVGDRLQVGSIVVNLDCRRYEVQAASHKAGLQRSRAQLRFAREQFKRAQNLKKKKSISEELLAQRQLDVAVAEANLETARQAVVATEIDIENCKVRAPISGVVEARHVSHGDYVNIGEPLISLVTDALLEVEANLRHVEIQSLSSGNAIEFDAAGKIYQLKLRQVVPVVDNNTATVKVRLLFTGEDKPFVGTSGRLRWRSDQKLLPSQFLLRREDQLGIFISQNEKAVFHVLPEAVEGRPASIDLSGNTLVIDEGRYRLNNGDAIKVVRPDNNL